jgi:hypothetical protein
VHGDGLRNIETVSSDALMLGESIGQGDALLLTNKQKQCKFKKCMHHPLHLNWLLFG